MPETITALSQLADLGLTAVLLVILWQGLLRFDRLLAVIIHLALLNHSDEKTRELAAQEIAKIVNKPSR